MPESSPTTPPQVLIVGAGPSGLILALTLLRNGIPVRIIEKNLLPRIGQRGAGLMPRSLELFEFLGIIDSVMQRSIKPPTARVYKGPEGVEIAKEFSMTPTLDPTPAKPYLNSRLLGQESLENIIQTEMKKYNSSVELAMELVSLEQFDDRVQVKIHKRNTENSEFEEESSTYKWVVGADGARGVVRKSLGLTFLGETKDEKFVIGDIKVEGLIDRWHMWGDLSTTGTAIRNTEIPGLFNFIVGGSHLENIDEITASQDAVREFLRDRTSHRSDIKFGEVVCYSAYRVNIRMVNNFGKGRVFIAGDAAHVHSPTGGQGMNTGIQDSFNLGWKLAHVIKGISPPSLLETYTEERLPVVAEMLDLTSKILKATIDKPGDESGWKRTGNLNQLGVNYRWSSIVVDQNTDSVSGPGAREAHSAYDVEAGGLLRAGDRAPDAPGLVKVNFENQESSESTRLFKLLSPTYHTVLIFAEAADVHATVQAVIAKFSKEPVQVVVLLRAGSTNIIQDVGCNVFEDRDGHAYDAYKGAEGANGIVIIRPDGVTGAIVKDVDWVERYFRAIFVESP